MWLGLQRSGVGCAAALIAAAAFAVACGDGVGVPIQRAADESAPSLAGEAGASAQPVPEQQSPPSHHDRFGDGDRDGNGDGDWSPELDVAHCADALDWPEMFASSEDALLLMINRVRQVGVSCGDRDSGSLWPLRLSLELQCSARLHSLDMAVRGFTGRTSPEGWGPGTRMETAGFPVVEWSEAIVVGETDPQRVLGRLLGGRESCAALASRELSAVGIGRHGELWTLDFARE